ncbi:saccharopine dehydrogenase NADP-binding domain-containing protein [Pseudonocardia kunmingensis]|uniref:Saccharopine dehydrogenase-like protein n=1 Tax=Pseudonocardia kunmingensis TaxID=630975 RepID=A0A543DJ20_9PSEU|nr:saccharopine dehydrogenase NADP-binding domain-containing protein [Pseudonocardia kunmingensis]TQM09337.1 saccharopine dehydrogenase-like protein [Pseudonocardia kunmingensis]
MTAPVLAVLGASGAVGSAAARALAAGHRLRLGGRREAPLGALAESLGAEVHPLDLDDDRALDAFCAGADVVLHCAAPAFAIGDRVARAAGRARAGYVDVSGDALLHDQLGAAAGVAVLGAGVVPGLSSLLPRYVLDAARAAGVEADRLTVHTGGVEPCTPGVARDMLLSLGTGGPDGAYGEPLAAWRTDRVVPRELRSEEDAEAPFFPGRVALQPFLAAEAQRLARDTSLAELDWYNVHPGPHVRAAMRRLRGLDEERAGAELIRAADLDLAGRTPYHLMVVTALDEAGAGRTAVLRSRDSYALTGFVAALAAEAVARGRVRPGTHYACDVLDPAETLRRIRASEVSRLTELVHDGSPADSLVEEGAL